MNLKTLLAVALGLEAQAKAEVGIVAIDARQLCIDHARAKATGNGQPNKPDRITLMVPPDILLSVAGDPKKARFRTVLVSIPEAMAKEIEERAESRIVRPGEVVAG